MNPYIEDALIAALFTVLGLILAFLFFVALPVTAVTSRECLEAGYPSFEVTWKFERYCVARVNQTDVVKPISEVRRAAAHR